MVYFVFVGVILSNRMEKRMFGGLKGEGYGNVSYSVWTDRISSMSAPHSPSLVPKEYRLYIAIGPDSIGVQNHTAPYHTAP